MKCFEGSIDEIYNYKIFIGFGIFILFMTGSMMYSVLEKFTKNNFGKIVSLIVSLIFVMGYPLNSLLFGFEYMSLGLLVLCTLFHLVYYFEKEEFKRPVLLFIFALVNFGLFCSYYMFIPFTYSGLWIYFCIYSYRKNKKIICRENIITLSVTLLLPFFLGYAYHLAPGIYNIFNMDLMEALQSSANYSSHIASSFDVEGYVYANYYSNMIILVPLTIYYLSKNSKKDKVSFDIIFFLILFAFIAVLFLRQGIRVCITVLFDEKLLCFVDSASVF